jgi:hypothetical protein
MADMSETRAHALCANGHRRWLRWWEGEDEAGRWYAAAVIPQPHEVGRPMPSTDGETPRCPCGAAFVEVGTPEVWG